jgi:hypothetical protein
MTDAVGERVIVSGTLNRFGNEPHTFLGVLVTPETPPVLDSTDGRLRDGRVLVLDRERVFELEGDLVSELDRYQGQRVTVHGVLSSGTRNALPPAVVFVEAYTTESEWLLHPEPMHGLVPEVF